MRFLIPILCRPTLAAILTCASIAAALGQDRSEADNRRDARLEWHSLANGRTEFGISDPALVPRRLALAAEQSGCHYKDEIKELPVHFISVEKRRLAIVFCRLGVTGSHQMFDLADLNKPKLMELPFIAQKDGFGTTPRPGMITWKKDVGVLEAETGTDICPSSRLRHTYRPGFTEGWVNSSPTFVIARVEVMEYGCGASGRQGTWTTVWEAPQWPKSVVVR
jgi:hypothetical protein